MPEMYEKYFEYWTLEWRTKDKKCQYSHRWHGINFDNMPDRVYRAACRGWDAHEIHCFVGGETEAIKHFHAVRKRWSTDSEHKDYRLRLVHIKKRVKMDTIQICEA